MAAYQWVATAEKRSFKRENRSQSHLVEQAEKLALADLDEPLHIAALCRVLRVSERTLRSAFHKTCGLAPCRRLRMLRLSQARCALLAANWRRVTVTEIATAFGFLELGRFSVEYRKVFGESPSQTLHGADSEIFRSTVLSKTVSLSEFADTCSTSPLDRVKV